MERTLMRYYKLIDIALWVIEILITLLG